MCVLATCDAMVFDRLFAPSADDDGWSSADVNKRGMPGAFSGRRLTAARANVIRMWLNKQDSHRLRAPGHDSSYYE